MTDRLPSPGTRHLDPATALVELEQLYEEASDALRHAVNRFLADGTVPDAAERARFRYPELRVTYAPQGALPSNRRAFAKFQAPGVYATTVTHPAAFRAYLLEQLRPLTDEYGATLEVRPGSQEIPYPYVFETGDELGRDGASASDLARIFPVPHLSEVGDEIADCTYEPSPGEPQPLSLFDALRVDYSLRRLVHYTGSDWRHIQPWILLTNYHRYVDQFVAWGLEQLQAGGRFTALVLPSGVRIEAGTPLAEAERIVAGVPWHRYQMPAYHLTGEGGGVSLVNIGVGPANAKNITDHLAVLRPHCWLMVGHCGGLRQSQQIGDYVLAHAYLREDRILDEAVPTGVPIPALAEVQVALQEAAARITGERGDALKNRLRTGTIVTYDDRNWELRWTRERTRINQSRAIAVDMESGTVATQGFRMRVPYGTLLCVSDKPLHGEIKLPGAANAFYERAVKQHLLIGLEAIDILRQQLDQLHSRKLRSFDEPPFR
jgi:AMP nucleosidase